MPDLKNPKAMYLKGFLFLLIVMVSGAWLIFEPAIWKRILLVVLLIWSSARLYYFMFYVIENYIDSEFKFSGIFDFLKYLVGKRK
jgi:hypothetical protein